MSNKIDKHFYIDKSQLDYLKELKVERNLSSINQALEQVIDEHRSKSDTTTEKMIKIIANEVSKELKNDLTKISTGLNFSDRNIQVIVEILNGLCIKDGVGDIVRVEDVKSAALVIAEESVKKRIVKNRVRKLDNE